MKLCLLLLLVSFNSIFANAFDLSIDLNDYSDTILEIEDFEYNPELPCGFGHIFRSESRQGLYTLYKLGTISHFGPVYATLFYAPYTPMDHTKTFSMVTAIGEDKPVVSYKHRDSLWGEDISYKNVLLSDKFHVGEYIEELEFTTIDDTSKICKDYLELIPFEQEGYNVTDDWHTPECINYVAFIRNEGHTLRLEVYPDVHRRTFVIVRFSTDSAGNGEFKLNDTPILNEYTPALKKRNLNICSGYIIVSSSVDAETVTLVNSRGQEVLTQVTTDKRISLRGITPGIYTAIIKTHERVIKEKILVR